MAAANASLGDLRTWTHHVCRLVAEVSLFFLFVLSWHSCVCFSYEPRKKKLNSGKTNWREKRRRRIDRWDPSYITLYETAVKRTSRQRYDHVSRLRGRMHTAKHNVHISRLRERVFADDITKWLVSHVTALAPRCILSNIMFKRTRHGCRRG